MDLYYKQPDYYSKFKCTGGECKLSCCDRWNVDWKESEIEKLNNTNCSERLKKLIESSFTDSRLNNYKKVKLCENGRCPFHNTDTGLCDIQRELGENGLSDTCRFYPRHFIKNRNTIMRWCDISCPALIGMLLRDEDALKSDLYVVRDYNKIDDSCVIYDSDSAIFKNKLKQYRFDLVDFYTELFLCKERSIETSVILGGIAMKHISEAFTNGRINDVPKILSDLSKQFSSPSVSLSVDEIKPNLQLKFKLVNNMIVQFWRSLTIGDLFSNLHDGTNVIMENYVSGMNKFKECFAGREYALKNVVTNLFYDLKTPFYLDGITPFENYSYFVISAASIIVIAALIGFVYENIELNFTNAVADMCRSLSHASGSAKGVIDNMKALGITSPAHLALIIK